MPEPEKRLNNNSLKVIIVVVTVVAVLISLITGMAAIIAPMQAEIESLRREIEKTELRFNARLATVKEIAELRIKLHEAAISHPMIFNEVRTLWRYHEKPIQGTP